MNYSNIGRNQMTNVEKSFTKENKILVSEVVEMNMIPSSGLPNTPKKNSFKREKFVQNSF